MIPLSVSGFFVTCSAVKEELGILVVGFELNQSKFVFCNQKSEKRCFWPKQAAIYEIISAGSLQNIKKKRKSRKDMIEIA